MKTGGLNMKYISKPLIDWAIGEIKTKYPEDISLLIGSKGWRIPEDGREVAFNFFIPATDRGYALAKTFIIDGIGYDLFPMSWERVEGLAQMNESLTACLADGIILYARTETEKNRFIKLQEQLRANLKSKDFIFNKALEKISSAMEIYKTLIFEDSLCDVRKGAGFITKYLIEAIMTFNGVYTVDGIYDMCSDLEGLEQVPLQFNTGYEQLIQAKTVEEIKRITYDLIKVTRDFFGKHDQREMSKESYSFEDLAAWYEEGRYTFRRISYYCEKNDVMNSFYWGYHFQHEFDYIQKDFGLNEMKLLEAFDANNLKGFSEKLQEIEAYIVSEIEGNGVKIHKYDTLEEFIRDCD